MPRLTQTLLLALCLVPCAIAQAPNDAQLQADVTHQLNKKQFRDIHAQIANGVVTLTGTVGLLADKLDAEKRIQKTKEASSIVNNIQVNGGEVSDQELFAKLGKGLVYDRQGYPSYPFNSITLQVKGGVVRLGGEVVEPVDKDSALSLVTNTKGVVGLVDALQVAPLSPTDWGIRRAEYQAVYGSPVATKYAMSPSKPIRIVVQNGHVILTGVVDSIGDKQILFQQANAVPGVFSVTNDLQVAGQSSSSESAH